MHFLATLTYAGLLCSSARAQLGLCVPVDITNPQKCGPLEEQQNCAQKAVDTCAHIGGEGTTGFCVPFNVARSDIAPFQVQDLSLYTLSDDLKFTFRFVYMDYYFANSALVVGCRPSTA
ncbi:hypothetical protein CGCFRS4_v015348 [Colletotrichum fructicola]|nr:hypothetical protein CGCFRS4_v015348 [Colletotrichum fructicola]KAF4926089.1 hypothetical protein CGCF245_v013776 [Colletotrichum fructicola]